MMPYSKEFVLKLAGETDFIRDNLEKVLRLVDILEFINKQAFLSDRLALKGGTAINLVVFDMPRLSVDIDFDYTLNSDKDTMLADKNEIHRIIEGYMSVNRYSLSPHSKSPHTLDSMVFQYVNAAGNSDNIKIEINYGMRCHVLPPEKSIVAIPFLNGIEVRTLAPVELFGGKIKALIERCACRDLYDVNNWLQNRNRYPMEDGLLRKIVLFYLAVGGNSQLKTAYTFESIDEISFKHIRASLIPVLRKSENYRFEDAKSNVRQFLQTLMVLTEKECEFVANFNKGVYSPELLFDDNDIVYRVRNHPMAIWKTRRS